MRRAIRELGSGSFRYELDDGQVIAVRVEIDRERGAAIVDFAGTSAQRTTTSTRRARSRVAAVMYVFRTLIDEPIPMNAGCLRPLTIVVPRGSLLDPSRPAAVVAGNVETSQCIVDALYGALGVLAASQGTMNNFTFGNATHQYYETIAGGAGAGPRHDGASGVQTHMTNSRLTDPEVLEQRFPVLLREFFAARRVGRRRRQRGGDGVVRTLEFREAMTVGDPREPSTHRPVRSRGRRAGSDRVATWSCGATAAANDSPGPLQIAVEPGDVVSIETPGGGGFGRATPAVTARSTPATGSSDAADSVMQRRRRRRRVRRAAIARWTHRRLRLRREWTDDGDDRRSGAPRAHAPRAHECFGGGQRTPRHSDVVVGRRGRRGRRCVHRHPRSGRQPVRTHHAQAAALDAMRDQERLVLRRARRPQTDQHVDAALGEVLFRVEALVADDVERVVGRAPPRTAARLRAVAGTSAPGVRVAARRGDRRLRTSPSASRPRDSTSSSSARRRGVSRLPSALPAAPRASVRNGVGCGFAARSDWIGLMPAWPAGGARPPFRIRAGREPGRNSSSSSGSGRCHGRVCSIRTSAPATAPQLANTS